MCVCVLDHSHLVSVPHALIVLYRSTWAKVLEACGATTVMRSILEELYLRDSWMKNQMYTISTLTPKVLNQTNSWLKQPEDRFVFTFYTGAIMLT